MTLNAGSAGSGTGLADELYDALNDAFGGVDSNIDNDRKAFCDVLATTIIDHITANAEVSTSVSVSSVSGVTTGSGTSGSGSGSGTGSVA